MNLTDIADSRSDELDFCSVFNVFYVIYEEEKNMFFMFFLISNLMFLSSMTQTIEVTDQTVAQFNRKKSNDTKQ